MLKIWGRLSSINVRKVVLAAQWLDIAFERIDAGHEFGIVGTPEYLAKNPNGMIPLIEDGAFSLWESNVIVRYLCARHPHGRLYPEELQARFDAERWMDWQQTTLNPAGRDAFLHLVRLPLDKRQPELISPSIAATEPLMALLDQHLSQRPFLAGGDFSMADIVVACELHRWRGLPIVRPSRPHLERWYVHIIRQPASRGVLDLPI